jgi:predicted phage terminase large subunit-like protein
LFPHTRITRLKEEDSMLGKFARTMAEVEVIGHSGSLKTVGVGGPLTGSPVDTLILDDIYKDAKTAWSPTHREAIQDWFDTVAESRLHNDSQVLIVFTRWHEHDLAGHLLEKEPDEWEVVKFPAIKEGPPDEVDPREPGEALWPEKHSVEKLLKTKERNPHVFQSLYQQEPRPKEGLLYKSLRTYTDLPAEVGLRKAVVDTADTGEDFMCVIAYMPTPTGYYVTDVYYTQEGMETTEPGVARMLTSNGVHNVKAESNNGGRGFIRNVERICRTIGNTRTQFRWYHQKDNKEVRIFSWAAEVQNMIYFPQGWEHRSGPSSTAT